MFSGLTLPKFSPVAGNILFGNLLLLCKNTFSTNKMLSFERAAMPCKVDVNWRPCLVVLSSCWRIWRASLDLLPETNWIWMLTLQAQAYACGLILPWPCRSLYIYMVYYMHKYMHEIFNPSDLVDNRKKDHEDLRFAITCPVGEKDWHSVVYLLCAHCCCHYLAIIFRSEALAPAAIIRVDHPYNQDAYPPLGQSNICLVRGVCQVFQSIDAWHVSWRQRQDFQYNSLF